MPSPQGEENAERGRERRRGQGRNEKGVKEKSKVKELEMILRLEEKHAKSQGEAFDDIAERLSEAGSRRASHVTLRNCV